MARKRGGLAGLYDRNKKYFKTLAPIALGAIPGVGVPLAAVAGAAMGADREGKGYFKGLASREGLEGAALGGLTGYMGGKMGQSAARGVKGMLTAGKGAGSASAAGASAGGTGGYQIGFQGIGAPIDGIPSAGFGGFGATPDLPAVNMASKIGMTPMAASAPRAVTSVPSSLMRAGMKVNAPGGGSGVRDMLRGTAGFLRENKDLIGAGVKGLQMALPDRANEAAMMNAETARQRLALEQGEMEEARRIREARSEMARRLLAPYIDQYSPALRGLLNG
jgi:hypothetical protein